MKQAGLSMALGAFLAGLLLAETEFSLQVESDIAPYRGLLLGLFFMTVSHHFTKFKNQLLFTCLILAKVLIFSCIIYIFSSIFNLLV